MTAPEIHYRRRGDTWTFPLTVTDEATDAAYTGLDTSTIVSTIRVRDSGTLLWTGTEAGGEISVTDNDDGELEVTVPHATTEDAELILYECDVEVTTAGGQRRTVAVFLIQVTKDVSTH